MHKRCLRAKKKKNALSSVYFIPSVDLHLWCFFGFQRYCITDCITDCITVCITDTRLAIYVWKSLRTISTTAPSLFHQKQQYGCREKCAAASTSAPFNVATLKRVKVTYLKSTKHLLRQFFNENKKYLRHPFVSRMNFCTVRQFWENELSMI